MATTKKTYYYVLVITNYGPVFVTGTGEHHIAYWDKEKEPKGYPKSVAEDITIGLGLNGYLAFTVTSKWAIDYQPYNYDRGEMEWKPKEEK